MRESLGEKLTRRLATFVETLEKKEDVSKRFTCRRIELNLKPQEYKPELVKATRDVLGVSQAIFARFLGVSVKAVSAWEQGKKSPRDVACRFMDEIRSDPAYWRDRLQRYAVPKSSA